MVACQQFADAVQKDREVFVILLQNKKEETLSESIKKMLNKYKDVLPDNLP